MIKQAGREGNEKESRDNSLLNWAGWTSRYKTDEGGRKIELRAERERERIGKKDRK